MKAGLVTSTVLHAALLGFGLLTLSAPRAYDVVDVESLPVEIVPIEELTRIQAGDKKEPLREKPAPKPTLRPDPVENAEAAGENSVDTKAPPVPESKPTPVETASLPETPPEPVPVPEPVVKPAPAPKPVEARPEPAPEPVAEAKPVPSEDTPPEPQPQQEAETEPAPEPLPEVAAEAETAALPQVAPRPETRPQPPRAQAAKAPEREAADKPVQEQASRPPQEKSDALLDDVAALLNKDKPSGGGAKRSTEEASLGGERKTAEKLSQSDMDALRQRLGGCWNIPVGVEDGEVLKISVRFRLDKSGNLEGRPEVIRGGASSGPGRIAAESAVRAVQKCEPFNLPTDKYDTWSEVVVNFDPSDMF